MENKSIVVYKDGSHKVVDSNAAWEYENDSDWLITISANVSPQGYSLERVEEIAVGFGKYYWPNIDKELREGVLNEQFNQWSQTPQGKELLQPVGEDWISVKDGLPVTTKECWCFTTVGVVVDGWYFEAEWRGKASGYEQITHWQYKKIPLPPKQI